MRSRLMSVLALLVVFIIPATGQVEPFYFMLLTDTQFGMYAADKEFSRETANYEFTVATVNRLKPRFVIILGDLVNKPGDPEQIREFQRITGKIDKSIPVYLVAGNHDVGHQPTPETVAAYRKTFGRDCYSFQAGPIYGIVLNSTLIHTSKNVQAEYQEQNSWLEKELQKAKESGLPHTVVFLHHPLFTKAADEPDDHGNIPLERRKPLLELLHKYGIRYVFAGHVHRSAVARDGALEMTAVGPVSMPFSEEGSGMRLGVATAEGIRHQFFGFGRMPDRLAIK